MTYDELMNTVLSIFPDAEIGEENGEIVIATGLVRGENNELTSIGV